ncbi:serine/threonine protein kinase [Catenulispora acidiphila DSM 44928]|uniref:non-specific serine/threonine protein kinase n=1 Tax=Catenulispora acidiphila (strain DSM 44928 / JCM 14897 / NBRC 102108 / NRRL B-24433 / ID139908) TaxID=479433 RepID=C7Q2D3_CATAD|nr:serine/threonine-protein kinase [Catenulispora acidiphila]ACU69775.1 serine/threonine protein kinase [Catenulispora acidiphila DSM 44928]
MDANRPAPGPGGYGGLGAGSIVSKNIQPLLETDPRHLGPYSVRGRLGQGAMGSVYLGFAPTGQAFALKVLRQDFASDRDFRKRFTREIAAARAVHSPFVNAVTDADPNAATPWLASYFIPGPPLSAAVQLAGPFSPRSVAHLGVGIGLALQAIHTAGIVHRDLKPANVLVASDGPRVIDFGIARAEDASMLTATGMRLGTPSFMAPEQVAGIEVEAPADVWAVGGMLIYAATGRTPFGNGDAMAILYRVENHAPDLQGLEPALAHIATRCLTKDPTARPTPAQLVDMCRAALTTGLAGHPALRGSDVTGWLPSAISRDLAARAVELANIGHPPPTPAPPPTTDPTTDPAGKPSGLGGFLRRKAGGQAPQATSTTGAPHTGQPNSRHSQGTAMGGGQDQYGQPNNQTGGGQYGQQPYDPQPYDPQPYGDQPYGDQQDPNNTASDQPGQQQPPTQYGQQPGQQPGQYGRQPGQYAQQPAPAWGPSGPSGSDVPTIITPPQTPAPEPQGPAWRAATTPPHPTNPRTRTRRPSRPPRRLHPHRRGSTPPRRSSRLHRHARKQLRSAACERRFRPAVSDWWSALFRRLRSAALGWQSVCFRHVRSAALGWQSVCFRHVRSAALGWQSVCFRRIRSAALGWQSVCFRRIRSAALGWQSVCFRCVRSAALDRQPACFRQLRPAAGHRQPARSRRFRPATGGW